MPELAPTPSHTVGPFFAFALALDGGPHLVPSDDPRAIRVHGALLDGAGEPVTDAIVELWQANAAGRMPEERGSLRADRPTFTGFGRSETVDGEFAFTTLEPGPVGGGAPSLLLTVFARGVTHQLVTRAYFPQHAAANETDAILGSVPASRRDTLVMKADGRASYRLDIRLQGEGETVFLDFHG